MSDDESNLGASSSEGPSTSEVIPGYSSIEQFTKDGYKVLMEAIKHSNKVPAGRDWEFYKTSDSFTKIMNDESNEILNLMNQIMKSQDVGGGNLKNKILDEKTELIIEANDMILEKVADNIDSLNGIKKTVLQPVLIQTVSAEVPINGSWNRNTGTTFSINSTAISNQQANSATNSYKLVTAKNIIRPQKLFKDKIDNSNGRPWQPRISDKPNSLKPLALVMEEFDDRQEFSHPYEYELDLFTPPPDQLLDEPPEYPKPLDETPLIEVTTSEQLDDLLDNLRSCKEFAVDLEHHSYRTFMGITCLMQISTREKDYLVDTFTLRDKLNILNEVFTKKSIVKVFHGADKDVEWLQRDLGIYVVNMFDTHQAAKLLEYSGLSLAYLMKRFCEVETNKQFQLADWRIRPLPEEFKVYAREDTHYLIYIYQMLKRELLYKANMADRLLKAVIERSTEICKKRYFKPYLCDDSHLNLYRRCKKMFDNRQLYALKEIYAWRDNMAREEDESAVYVLPNHMMMHICETLPREMQGILACCSPIPPLLRSHLLEVHQIVLKARDQCLERAILTENTTRRGIVKKVSKIIVDSPLHCPHDLTKASEFRDDLPTLLSNFQLIKEVRATGRSNLTIEKLQSSYSVFHTPDNSDDEAPRTSQKCKTIRNVTYLSPYERYVLVKPFVQAEEEKAAAEKEELEKQKVAKENRTDDERIASIREHFMEMSKKFNDESEARRIKEQQEQEREMSLLQMGGSRKRKREPSDSEPQEAAPYPDYQDRLHTPMPNIQSPFNRNKGRKRKMEGNAQHNYNNSQHHQQQNQGHTQIVSPKKSPKKKHQQINQPQNVPRQQNNQPPNLNQPRRTPKQARRQQQELDQQNNQPQNFPRQQNNQPPNHNQQYDQPPKHSQQNANQKNNQPHVSPKKARQQQNANQKNNQPQVSPKKARQQQNFIQQNAASQNINQQNGQPKILPKKTRWQQKMDQPNYSNPNQGQGQSNQPQGPKKPTYKKKYPQNVQFVPHDYSSVDFRQFQGGAGSANMGAQIKPNFRGKGRKQTNKGANKSAFFGATSGGRGRGRGR